MVYTPQTWVNALAGGTPLSAARLNVMEAGIAAADLHVRTYAGTPEGNVTAPVGELCTNTVTGKLYLKATGVGNTGWVLAGSLSAVTIADLPAGSVIHVAESGGAYVRPTARTDVCVIFTGTVDPVAVALNGDKWDKI